MGKGGDATDLSVLRKRMPRSDGLQRSDSMLERLKKAVSAEHKLQRLRSVKNDLQVLKAMWFNRVSGESHAERLEKFYSPQAHLYDGFRSKFLWAREPMLAACAARLQGMNDLVWVDLGGGTGENIELMSKYMDLQKFSRIYIVDLCSSLCQQARQKVISKDWENVTVIEGDACQFRIPDNDTAQLVTFSYSLSMIPPFHAVIDRAISYLDPDNGLLGVADFYVSGKHDYPMRQMPWAVRFFWRSIFDTDGIDLGPERRSYLDHQLSRVWELNDEGTIPWVPPFLKAPWYAWVGRIPKLETLLVENRIERPPLFPATFLYTQSWEDPRADEPYLKISSEDVCLTLTSGGCNALDLCIQGAKAVYSVDCNPAQSALLELKREAIKNMHYEDVWSMFGEGVHPRAESLFQKKLAPYMSQTSIKFWRDKIRYFNDGLYFHGGMGKVVAGVQFAAKWLGLRGHLEALAEAPTLEAQRKAWNNLPPIRAYNSMPAWGQTLVSKATDLLLFNRLILWFGGGVPGQQRNLIVSDGVPLSHYVSRTMNGVALNSHVRKDNYFYYNCLTGRFARNNCPAYLTKTGFRTLRDENAIQALHIVNGFFLPTLKRRMYSVVVLMDHVDWLQPKDAQVLAQALGTNVVEGGRVIWRSAALCPPYVTYIEDAGFEVTCIQRADKDEYLDRVNMYASFWVAVKKAF